MSELKSDRFFGEYWPRWALERGLELKLSPNARHLLLVLAVNVNYETSTEWASYDWLIAYTGRGRSTVAAALKEIRDARAMGSSGSRGTGASAEYWPLESSGPDSSPSPGQAVRGDTLESSGLDREPSTPPDSSLQSAQPDAMESSGLDALESSGPDTEVRREVRLEDPEHQHQEVPPEVKGEGPESGVGEGDSDDSPLERLAALLFEEGVSHRDLRRHMHTLTVPIFDDERIVITAPQVNAPGVQREVVPLLQSRGLEVELVVADSNGGAHA